MFYIHGHKVAELSLPEPEHLESLIVIPFDAQIRRLSELSSGLSFYDYSAFSSEYAFNHVQNALLDLVSSLLGNDPPIISIDEANCLNSLILENDQRILDAYGRYFHDNQLSKFVRELLSIYASSLGHPATATMQQTAALFCDELYSKNLINSDDLFKVKELIKVNHPSFIIAYERYVETESIERLLQDIQNMVAEYHETRDSRELRDGRQFRFRLQMLVFLQDLGLIDSTVTLESIRLLEQNDHDILEVFGQYEVSKNREDLAQNLIGLFYRGQEELEQGSEDDEEQEGQFGDGRLSTDHPFVPFLKKLQLKKCLHEEDVNQLQRMIAREEKAVMAIFDAFVFDHDWDSFVETLQCLMRVRSVAPDEVHYMIESLVLDDVVREEDTEELARLVDEGNSVIHAAHSLYLEDEDWEELEDTVKTVLKVSLEANNLEYLRKIKMVNLPDRVETVIVQGEEQKKKTPVVEDDEDSEDEGEVE